VIPPALLGKVQTIAWQYSQITGGKTLLITDGARTAADQANLLLPLLRTQKGRASQLKLYVNKRLLRQVFAAYDSGSTDAERLDAMTATIQGQMNRGAYLSAHLRNNAVDIRCRGSDAANIRALRRAIRAVPGAKLVDETRTKNPHWHLQFK
jgi:hypothetical protein